MFIFQLISTYLAKRKRLRPFMMHTLARSPKVGGTLMNLPKRAQTIEIQISKTIRHLKIRQIGNL